MHAPLTEGMVARAPWEEKAAQSLEDFASCASELVAAELGMEPGTLQTVSS